VPLVSVVMASRDRPQLFAEALASVMAQAFTDFNVVVVNDGSSVEHQVAYEEVYAAARAVLGDRLQVHTLVRRPKGHGQSYSLNFGVSKSDGVFVCFLDDDDTWTDRLHLTHLSECVASPELTVPVDLYMGNQRAFFKGVEKKQTVWLEDLAGELQKRGHLPLRNGTYKVAVDDLLATHGFCHVNCLIVRRSHFDVVGGFDEGIRWENDHDFFLRAIDEAVLILHHPAVMARHNIPDPTKTGNMTTAISMLEKRLYQVRVFDKTLLFANTKNIRDHARMHKGYILRKISLELIDLGRWKEAARYAAEALGVQPGFKWSLFVLYCGVRALFAK
jgi:glycosyltransferase involved in cell wall biosynthesis